MKILYLANQPPVPANNGVRIPLYHSMRLMKEAGHEIHLVLLNEGGAKLENELEQSNSALGLASASWICVAAKSKAKRILWSVFHRLPHFLHPYADGNILEQLQQVVSDIAPDSIHVDLVTLAHLGSKLKFDGRRIASINDCHSFATEERIRLINYSPPKRLVRQFELTLSKRFESTIYPSYDSVHVVSKHDADYLTSLNPAISPCVVSNGVNSELFQLPSENLGNTNLVYVADLSGGNRIYLVQFLTDVWPHITKSIPDAKLSIVGKVPREDTELVALCEKDATIELVGYVEDLADAYRLGGISIVPIRKKCGILNKAIEGMAAGHVIIGYESTFSGIPQAEHRTNVIACKETVDMLDELTKLMSEPEHLQQIQKAAASTAKAHYDWSTRSDNLQNMYFGNR